VFDLLLASLHLISAVVALVLTTGAKAWGEVSPSSGGVIIPYLSALDLTGARSGRAPSFGYSDCLKWGYEDSIKVATFNATQAVGILGLDLTRVRRSSEVLQLHRSDACNCNRACILSSVVLSLD
jgi:hypothetical protein